METHRVDAPRSAARLSLRVDCIVRTDRVAPQYRIRAIGGRGREGDPWRLSEEAAIAAIQDDRASFYVERPKGQRVDVVVAQSHGKAFLKCVSDDDSPDTLLALPACD